MEKYTIKERGYHPFLIRDGWQIAQLNYVEDFKVENIKRLDVHNNTDEAFMLISGVTVLITAKIVDEQPLFELERMMPGTTYNVPVKTWHNIAMQKGSQVIIIEKDNTHLGDFEFFDLSQLKRKELIEKVNKIYNDENLER